MKKKKRVAGIGMINNRIVTFDEYEMDYWDLHPLPFGYIILEDLRSSPL